MNIRKKKVPKNRKIRMYCSGCQRSTVHIQFYNGCKTSLIQCCTVCNISNKR